MDYDVIVIGAGVTGAAVARYLSRYDARILVLERASDVCEGTSKANSAIVHAGFDAEYGSMMAKFNVRGSEMMEDLSKELDFAYDRCGSLVVALSEEDLPKLQALYENGVKNGVRDLRIVSREELLEMEPNISDAAVSALYAPTGGIVCPFELTIALSENAAVNGAEFLFNAEVQKVVPEDGGFTVESSKGSFTARAVVNAAGVYADLFHNQLAEKKIHITPRKGEYLLLDHTAYGFVKHTIFQLPGEYGKGVLVSPTVHKNIIVGPTANDIEDKEGVNTTAEGLREVIEKSALAVRNLPTRQTITSFAGLRAHEDSHEFVIGEVPEHPGFFDCAGIESPGLSSAPAIGEEVSDQIAARLGLPRKAQFIAERKGIVKAAELSLEERNELIRKEPAYGQIICRCESVSEGEILDAIRRPLGATTLDGVKRRVRAGMGRCQAGFCSPRVMEILARELHQDLSEITKKGPGSPIIVGTAKDRI